MKKANLTNFAYDNTLPRGNPHSRGEAAYLTKRFHPVRQQGDLIGATQLRSTRTKRSSLC